MMPPKDIPADELFSALQRRPAPNELTDFPVKINGQTVHVRCVVLKSRDYDTARAWAGQKMRDEYGEHAKDESLRQVHADWIGRWIISRSFRSSKPIHGTEDDYAVIFPEPEDVAHCLTADEMAVAWAQVQLTQQKYGPIETNVYTDEEITAWIVRLKEGAEKHPLARLSLLDLATLTRCLAERLYASCAALGALRSSLPVTLDAIPESWGIGTSLFGAHVATSVVPGLFPSGSPLTEEQQQAERARADGAAEHVESTLGILAQPTITAKLAAQTAGSIGRELPDPDLDE